QACAPSLLSLVPSTKAGSDSRSEAPIFPQAGWRVAPRPAHASPAKRWTDLSAWMAREGGQSRRSEFRREPPASRTLFSDNSEPRSGHRRLCGLIDQGRHFARLRRERRVACTQRDDLLGAEPSRHSLLVFRMDHSILAGDLIPGWLVLPRGH